MYRYNQNENKFNKDIRQGNQSVELTNKKDFLMHSKQKHKNEMNRGRWKYKKFSEKIR